MRCMNCYQEIPDSCKFCPNCGAKQPVQKMEPVSQVKEETTDNITEDTAEVQQPTEKVQSEEDVLPEEKVQPEEDVQPLLCGAMAFVFPSVYEGFGMPPLEAMACGTPVLTTRAASLPEVVGDAAVIVDPHHTEDIAEGLEKLFLDAALRERLQKEGLRRAAMFSWENAAAALYDVYQEALTR